jgi:serine-type D-Ala-D-Ala carboxypeptidase/endopeptidase (penicillin-binding protein 4)
MLQLFSSGLLSLWLDQANVSQLDVPINLRLLEQTPMRLMAEQHDKSATAAVQDYVEELVALGFNPESQGIWLQSDYQILGNHQGSTPLTAASLTKAATSLVALKNWGPNHQFTTLISTSGVIQNQVLEGDLVIQGGGDPLFVWETAIELGNALNRLGVQRVTGNLVISGNFAMNFERNPQMAGDLLRQALDARNWPDEAAYYYEKMPLGTSKPLVEIVGPVQVVSQSPTSQRLLLRHSSFSLVQLLKQMNIYSNNEMAEMFSKSLGGGTVVAQQSAWLAAVSPDEIQLVNGSGLGQENRISPRAVCAIFTAMEDELQRWKSPSGSPYTIADVFPVSGLDQGTLENRVIPSTAVVKTGTLADVSALAGVLPTRDRGLVWFAIINRGDDIDGLRSEQDQTLQALANRWGTPLATPQTVAPTFSNAPPLSSQDLAQPD